MTFFYDINKKLAEIQAKPTPKQLNEGQLAEKIEPPIKTNPAEKGKYKGKGVDELKSQLSRVKKQMAGYKERGEKVPAEVRGKFSELTFAIRGKQAHGGKWGSIKENDMTSFGANFSPINELMGDIGEGGAFGNAVRKAKADGVQPGEKIRVGGREYPLKEKMSAAKARNFAALAPPKDKITFADKIAGAKKEVDEMLGDVAAEAIKGALSPKQKKLDVNKNGKLDANDFAMLRKGNKQKTEEGEWDAGSDEWYGLKKPKKSYHDAEGSLAGRARVKKEPEKHLTAKGGEVTKTATGMVHKAKDRTGEPDTEPAPGEKRGRGRPKGKGGPRQERVTAKSRKQDRTAHGQQGFKAAKTGTKKVKENERSKYHNDLDQTSLHWSKEVRDLEDPQGKATKYVPNRDQYRVHTGAVAPDAVKDRIKRRQTKGGPAGPKWGQMLPREGVEENDFVPGHDRGEYDREGEMAKQDLKTAKDAAAELRSILDSDENLPEWVQAKITKAVDYLDTTRDYMKSKDDELEPVAEKAVSRKQQKFMGMVHAAQKGKKPASTEVAKVAKTMKKKDAEDFASTKHKGLPEKVKPKKEESKKEVEETTTAGSVATSTEAPKGKKGGMQFGKGIYESMNKQYQTLLNEEMNVNVSINSDGSKSINVSATDEDAEMLAQLLNLAGVKSQESACPTCNTAPCDCASQVDENKPDYPVNMGQEEDTNFMTKTIAGGLNKEKYTGQTTIPVIASQLDRQVTMGENVQLERKLFDLYKEIK